LFHLTDFDGELDCGDTVTEGGDGSPAVTLTRGDNGSCERIPFALRTNADGDDQEVELLKDLGNQTTANFTMQIIWEPETAVMPLPATQVDFGTGLQNVKFCNGPPANPTLPPGVPWCVTSRLEQSVAPGIAQLTENYFGAGDPRWAR
jgi:hypothetical protein